MDSGASHFGDRRVDEAGRFLHDRLVRRGPRGISVRSVGGNRAGEVRIGRFLRNGKVPVEIAVEAEAGALLGLVATQVIERSGGEKASKHAPLRDKQSRRWLDGMRESARLGGWTGYYGKPGPVVMLKGLYEFRTIQLGYNLALAGAGDV